MDSSNEKNACKIRQQAIVTPRLVSEARRQDTKQTDLNIIDNKLYTAEPSLTQTLNNYHLNKDVNLCRLDSNVVPEVILICAFVRFF